MFYRPRIRHGGESGFDFDRMYGRFRKPILNYVLQRVSDEHLAEELTQEIFLKVYRFRNTYQPRFQFSTWLWTIARNTLTDWMRKGGGAFAQGAGDSDDPLPDVEQIPAPEPNIELKMTEEMDLSEVGFLVGSLTAAQRNVLYLRIVHQHSFREIADKLNLSLAAVKCLFQRGKGALTKTMRQRERIKALRIGGRVIAAV